MTAVQTLPKPADTSTADDRPLHFVCGVCYPIPAPGNLALCGYRCVDGVVLEARPTDVLCVVCEDLVPHGCPKCGEGRPE